ncbi:MAG: ParB/RepB/Spo0J family partition protein [Bacteroidales bacterium]|nr:ParB/RepB/Spo0J family partition protein [Bacteroidales bacterium]
MKKERKPIGKGLSALFEEMPAPETLRARPVQESPEPLDPEPAAVESAVPEIEIGKIDANPLQPRDEFDEATLRELSASIQAMGLIQPVTVRRDGDRYQLISGERRLRASRMAGLERIPAYVREADDTAALEMALVENIQREDLDPVEIALALRRLTEECSLTQEQLAERVGMKRASVANYLRLLRLPAKLQRDLKDGLLSMGHAKVLLGVPDPALQERLGDAVVFQGLSVRQLEQKVDELLRPAVRLSDPALPAAYHQVLNRISRYFSGAVTVHRSAAGKGSMTVRFRSDDEIDAFLKALESLAE